MCSRRCFDVQNSIVRCHRNRNFEKRQLPCVASILRRLATYFTGARGDEFTVTCKLDNLSKIYSHHTCSFAITVLVRLRIELKALRSSSSYAIYYNAWFWHRSNFDQQWCGIFWQFLKELKTCIYTTELSSWHDLLPPMTWVKYVKTITPPIQTNIM